LFLAASPLPLLMERAEAWSAAAPGREHEMCTIQSADHTFSSRPHENIVLEQTLHWLERRFGPGYPRAWQGPPPTMTPATPPRDDSPDAQVPMLTTGALLAPVVDSAPVGQPPAWQLHLPEGRSFALTEPLRQLVRLVDG